MDARLLDFIVIGASKSGTTSLFRYLQHHPALYLVSVLAELIGAAPPWAEFSTSAGEQAESALRASRRQAADAG